VSSAGYWIGALLAFLSELASLAALAFWGATVPHGTGLRVLAAVGLPLAAAALWWLFAAPRAKVQVPALAVVTKVVVHGGAVAALVVTGHAFAAGVLAAAVVLGQLLTALSPREERPAAR
jgi:hypothetical protein